MQIAEAELVFSTLVKNLNNDGQVIEVSFACQCPACCRPSMLTILSSRFSCCPSVPLIPAV